jgi:hypothetical protein
VFAYALEHKLAPESFSEYLQRRILEDHARTTGVTFLHPGTTRVEAGVTIGAGETLLAPKGVPHTYRVESREGARWLVITRRGDFERFVHALSRPAERPERTFASNRQARHEYEILESIEAGIALTGAYATGILAMMVSASVVGMPCGKPLEIFNVLFFSNFADSGAESA